MARYVVLDFETFSCADLNKVGAWRYAEDPSTGILCIGFKVVTDGVPAPTVVITEQKIAMKHEALFQLCLDDSVVFVAHNAGFEQAIWKHVMVAQFGWPELPPHRWHDTMAVAARMTLPMALGKVGEVLNLRVQKDFEGHRTMMQMCKPGRDGNFDHSPEKLKRLIQYNVGDVDSQYELHKVLGGLGPQERRVWIQDQIANQRGIMVDVPYVRQCMDLLEKARGPLEAEFKAITGINPTQRAKILEWIQAQGVAMTDMRKATLDAMLDPENDADAVDDLPAHVHKVISIRRMLASSSVAKLGRMIETMNFDGRIRGTMQYHGARTGRNAGRLVQPLNMPRPTVKELSQREIMALIREGNLDKINIVCGNAYDAVISTLRGCFRPAPGKMFAVGDFNAIEARIVLALAGEFSRAQSFDTGDPYTDMGKSVGTNRQGGKTIVLGCFTADTRVLTARGVVAIQSVTEADLVWDGEEWVTHQGVIFQGVRPTIRYLGVGATPEHRVLTPAGWVEWAAALRENGRCLRSGIALANLWWSASRSGRGAASSKSGFGARAAQQNMRSSIRVWFTGAQPVATDAPNENQGTRSKNFTACPTSCRTTRRAHGGRAVTGLCSLVATSRNLLRSAITAGAGSEWLSVGTAAPLSWPMFSAWTDGTTPCSNSTGLTITTTTNPATSAWLRVGSSRLTPAEPGEFFTKVGSGARAILRGSFAGLFRTTRWFGGYETAFRRKNVSPDGISPGAPEPVFDLLNCGPRNRFTVVTDDGLLVVHNCGFQMSATKFALVTGQDLDFAERAVAGYRRDFAPLVPKLWYGLDKASADAVWCNSKKAYSYRGITYQMRGDYLVCTLPSQREIYYFQPRREQGQVPWDLTQIKPAWSFLSFQGKQAKRKWMFGGLATENVVQATARDIMIEAMFRAEAEGLPMVFTVYDELVTEPPASRTDAAIVLGQCMEERSDWVRQFNIPIRAECELMQEYQK